MPLHDWNNLEGWEGVHHYWLSELGLSIKAGLPAGYRCYLGSMPTLKVGTEAGKPDVTVRQFHEGNGSAPSPGPAQSDEPEVQVATLTLDPNLAVMVAYHGRLIAAIEIISPGNKDWPSSREAYLARYLGYLTSRVNLMLVDVHPRPIGFSFADELAKELGLTQPPLRCPMAIVYRVGGPAPEGGSFLGMWRRELTPGQPLPKLSLPLSDFQQVQVDLEGTYTRAAAASYLT